MLLKPQKLCLLALALGSLPLFAANSPWEWNAQLQLRGRFAQEALDQAQVFGPRLGGSISYTVSPTLAARASAEVRLETGSSQVSYLDEYGPAQTLRLREAVAEFTPFSSTAISAGALNQDDLDSPLLLADQTFPGLRERHTLQTSWGAFEVLAQQAVATSPTSLLPAQEDRAIGVPLSFFERIRWTQPLTPDWMIQLDFAHYAFANLPNEVARRSRFFGNSVAGLGPRNAFFLSGFQGGQAGAKVSFQKGAWESYVRAAFARNFEVDGTSQDGLLMQLGTRFAFSRTTGLQPSISIFKVGSGVGPALYNNREWGHSNRVGYDLKLGASFDANRWQCELRYAHASTLDSNPYQSDFQWIGIQWGANL